MAIPPEPTVVGCGMHPQSRTGFILLFDGLGLEYYGSAHGQLGRARPKNNYRPAASHRRASGVVGPSLPHMLEP